MNLTPDNKPFVDLVQVRAAGAFGTGLLVGRGIVLTALHCVADPKAGWRLRDNVGVYLLRELQQKTERHLKAHFIGGKEDVADPADVALLAIEGPDPPRALGCFGFCELPQEPVLGSMRGFPAVAAGPRLP